MREGTRTRFRRRAPSQPLTHGVQPTGTYACDSVSDYQQVLGSGGLAGVQRQYEMAEWFPSLTDVEDEDDGVEFCCWGDKDGR